MCVRAGVCVCVGGVMRACPRQVLSRLWYDFDSTPLLLSRAPTTWRKARRVLTTATAALLSEARAWAGGLPADADEGTCRAELRAIAVRLEVYT